MRRGKPAAGAGLEAVFRAGIPVAGDRGTFTATVRCRSAVSEASAPRYRAKINDRKTLTRPSSFFARRTLGLRGRRRRTLTPTKPVVEDVGQASRGLVDVELSHVTSLSPCASGSAPFLSVAPRDGHFGAVLLCWRRRGSLRDGVQLDFREERRRDVTRRIGLRVSREFYCETY